LANVRFTAPGKTETLFFFYGNQENRMPSTITTIATAATAPQAVPAGQSAAVDTSKPAIIATRQRCEADGVGLSHYILMDRKGGQ